MGPIAGEWRASRAWPFLARPRQKSHGPDRGEPPNQANFHVLPVGTALALQKPMTARLWITMLGKALNAIHERRARVLASEVSADRDTSDRVPLPEAGAATTIERSRSRQ